MKPYDAEWGDKIVVKEAGANHDLKNRYVLKCKPIRICRNGELKFVHLLAVSSGMIMKKKIIKKRVSYG